MDLEKGKRYLESKLPINPLKPIITRAGSPVKILSIHPDDPRPYLGEVETSHGFIPFTWTISGHYKEKKYPSALDIFNVPE